ncbi:MAG: TraR/DksA C4-type zinc finger protein [Puniceicoccales bacterium]|jgi:RNA polymerase-binding transcription factor DksA|nr:TraR/DksA C4-type zinc finger protein [Puniceicoccales bacterium]
MAGEKITTKAQTVDVGEKRFFRTHKKDDSFFSIDDAREAMRAKMASSIEEQNEKTIERKKNILFLQAEAQPQQKVGAASIADILGFNPIQSKQTSARDRDPDEIPQKYRKYYKLLLKLKDDVKKGLSKLTNENLAISVGQARHDGTDQEIESFDSEFAISLMANEQEALTEIEEAIQRIYGGTYGICELTGKSIEAQRLLAVPFARYSIEGQQEIEKNKQLEVSRGSVFQIDQSDDELAEFEKENDE